MVNRCENEWDFGADRQHLVVELAAVSILYMSLQSEIRNKVTHNQYSTDFVWHLTSDLTVMLMTGLGYKRKCWWNSFPD